METTKRYTIGELGELAGISRRAVRYYVQRGLISPPLGAGRGHYYTDGHLLRLRAVKELQARGFSLDDIEQRLGGQSQPPGEPVAGSFRMPKPGPDASPPTESRQFHSENRAACYDRAEIAHGQQALPEEPPTLWTRLTVADGIELQVEAGRYRLSPARLERLRRAVRAILGGPYPPEFFPQDDER